MVKRADGAEASNLDDDKEDVEDDLDFDSCNEDAGEAAGEQLYWTGSVPYADSGDDVESLSLNELQQSTTSINLAKSPTKRIDSESLAIFSQATTALNLSHSTCSIFQRDTESQSKLWHLILQKLLKKRGAESQYDKTDKRTRR